MVYIQYITRLQYINRHYFGTPICVPCLFPAFVFLLCHWRRPGSFTMSWHMGVVLIKSGGVGSTCHKPLVPCVTPRTHVRLPLSVKTLRLSSSDGKWLIHSVKLSLQIWKPEKKHENNCLYRWPGAFQNPCELINLRALKITILSKIKAFNVWVSYFVLNFKGSTLDILLIHWKITILYNVKNSSAPRFKSS